MQQSDDMAQKILKEGILFLWYKLIMFFIIPDPKQTSHSLSNFSSMFFKNGFSLYVT